MTQLSSLLFLLVASSFWIQLSSSAVRDIGYGERTDRRTFPIDNRARDGSSARGTRKMLTVSSGSKTGEFDGRTPIIKEGQTWKMECPGGSIVIDDAVYGVNRGFFWVTPKMMELCSGKTTCSVKASKDNFGDPMPGVDKLFHCQYHCICSLPKPRRRIYPSSSTCQVTSLKFAASFGNPNVIVRFYREQTALHATNNRLSCPHSAFLRKHTVTHRNIEQYVKQVGWNQKENKYDGYKTIFYSAPGARVAYSETNSADECYNTVGYQEAYLCTFNNRLPNLYRCQLLGSTCLVVHAKLTGHLLHYRLYCGGLTPVAAQQGHFHLKLK